MAYLDKILPEPFTILGLELKPLALGHVLFLQRLNCSAPTSADELVTAITICSQPAVDVEATLTDPWLGWKLWFWQRRLGEVDWVEKIVLWSDYWKANTSAPNFEAREENKNPNEHSGTPFAQHLKVFCQAKLNMTPSEAWNYPFTQALMDYYTYHEMEGNGEVSDMDYKKSMRQFADDNRERWLEMATNPNKKRATNGA